MPNLVSNLKQQLEVAGLDTLHLSDDESKMFALAVNNKALVFDRICNKKPDKDPMLLLLGLLTKSHIDAIHNTESQIEQICAMKEVFVNTLDKKHVKYFQADCIIRLSLVTKLWLMVQGYLNMDFSLANEHATRSALLLSRALSCDPEAIRTELLASYYHGKEKHHGDHPNTFWPDKFLSWLHLAKH